MLLSSNILLTQRGKGSAPRAMRTEFQGLAVTPSDTVDLPGGTTRALQVTGSGGNVNVNLDGGGTAVLTSLVAGQILEIAVTRVLSTSTTATGLVALYE